KYEYRPLKDLGAIRLIELQPSTDQNARLECTLLHTTFAELSDEVVYHYCALSYVWGSSKDTMAILVDEKELLVTVSLGTALLYLRDPRIPRYLWADAICINQNDDEEKSIQVTQMGEVYKAARHTIIWLGKVTIGGLAEDVLSCIRSLSKRIQTQKRFTNPDGLAGSYVLQEPSYVAMLEVSMGSSYLNGLEALLDLTWFTRVWIYQELLFSPDPWLQLGRTRIRWSELSTVVSSLSDKDQLREPCKRFLAMDKARQSFHAERQRENRSRVLLNTLVARRGLGVLDPRDMIFAHLGIVAESPLDGTPQEWNLFRADYKKDCAELYRDVAQYLSRRIEIFELLSHVETVSNLRHSDTPSWAPNW
ncbi:HET-domain-containing protein, partial [Hyaloscypha hepaticicola]